jgi:hypothetical protein
VTWYLDVLNEEAVRGEWGFFYSPGHAETPSPWPFQLVWVGDVALPHHCQRGWPLRIVGIVEQVVGMLGGGLIFRWAGDRVVMMGGRCALGMVVVEEDEVCHRRRVMKRTQREMPERRLRAQISSNRDVL